MGIVRGRSSLCTMEANYGGFNFENVTRNQFMQEQGMKMPGFRKTGTTIVGCVYKDGVVLGADTRATGDTTVVDKNCEKIHKIADNIYCCGAGTAADTQQVTDMISSQLELHRMQTGRQSRVSTSLAMLKQMLFRCLIVVWRPHLSGVAEQIPGASQCGTRAGWCGPEGATHLHCVPAWLHRQPGLCHHGVWLPGRHVDVRGAVQRRHGARGGEGAGEGCDFRGYLQ